MRKLNLFLLTYSMVIIIVLTGCSLMENNNSLSSNSKESDNLFDITFELSNVSNTSATVNIVRGSDGFGELCFNLVFWIEKYENGEWEEIDSLYEELSWDSIASKLLEDDEAMLVIDWTNIYGELNPGKYRIAKLISTDTSDDAIGQYCYGEFEIT